MRSLIDTEKGIFCPIGEGHILTTKSMPPSVFELGRPVEMATMFTVNELLSDGSPVGFYLYSGFKVLNKGGVLVTYMESKRGKATDGSVVFRHNDLVVYDINGCGSIAVSPSVNDMVASILSEQ